MKVGNSPINALARKVGQVDDVHMLREPESYYSALFDGEKVDLSGENTFYFDENAE